MQVLAATQTPGEAGMNWFQGTADAVRQFTWVFEVGFHSSILRSYIRSVLIVEFWKRLFFSTMYLAC